MKMKVILNKDVKGLGKKGEIVEVSEGYGRNFLLPKKLAVLGTESNINVAKAKAGSAARKKAMEADEAKLLAAQLAKVSVTLTVKIGEGGKLYGSITGKDVAQALAKDGIEVDKRKITLDREVTGAGEYTATIKVHADTTAQIKVTVIEG